MNIAIVGTGYVGLVTGVCFADFGVNVTCVDKDADRIARLARGEVPIHEPRLGEMLRKNLAEGRLHFTTDTAHAVRQSLVVFIAVGTPSSEDGSPDLRDVLEVAREIGRDLDGYKVVVTKSTVPNPRAWRFSSARSSTAARRGFATPPDRGCSVRPRCSSACSPPRSSSGR